MCWVISKQQACLSISLQYVTAHIALNCSLMYLIYLYLHILEYRVLPYPFIFFVFWHIPMGSPTLMFPYSNCSDLHQPFTVKPVLSIHIKQDIFLAFQTGCCLLLHESSAERPCFLPYFHSAISSHLSIAISISPEWMVA